VGTDAQSSLLFFFIQCRNQSNELNVTAQEIVISPIGFTLKLAQLYFI